MDERSGSPARMQIDWDAPITDGRRRRPARRCVPADRRGEASGDPELWALRQGPVVPGRLQGQLGAPDQGCARGAGGLEQQVPELGAGRSGEMGAGRLCLRARRLARRRSLAGPSRRVVAARGAGSLPMRRMGRHAALEQRQGRHQRHLLLRHEPVAGRARSIRRTSPPCASGKVRPTIIASSAGTAASSSDFLYSWYPRQVASVQHGVGERGARSVVTGELGGRTATH